MVRNDGERAMLFQLDNDVQRLATEKGSNDATVVSLTGIYHNLLHRCPTPDRADSSSYTKQSFFLHTERRHVRVFTFLFVKRNVRG